MECKNCIYAEIVKQPRKIVKGDTTMFQSAGSVDCTCPHIRSLSFIDDELTCSEYKEVK